MNVGVASALKGEKPALHQHSMSMKAVDTATLDYSLENDIWCGFSPSNHAADRSRSFFRLSSFVRLCVSLRMVVRQVRGVLRDARLSFH